MSAKERINLLEVIPCRSKHISSIVEGEEIILSFPRFRHSWMNRYLMPRGMSKEIHVRLEEYGSAVWKMIDGKRTVSDIIDGLAKRFQNESEYESRVTNYLLQLHKDGFIKWMVAL